MSTRLTGLIAATYTPFYRDGSLNLEPIPQYTEFLLRNQVRGLYVCGSTGEGVSMTTDERRRLAEAFVAAVAGRVPVIVQVGHNSLHEARQLAQHAAKIGADVISATCPFYFKPASVELLTESMAWVAAGAPDLPFYYYHIPAMTGVQLSMSKFLEVAGEQIPSLAGLKYTAPTVHEFQACQAIAEGRFDLLWGCDEMLLSALSIGARGAVGSTYNIAAGLYSRLIQAFDESDLEKARDLQGRSVAFINVLARRPFHSAMKSVLKKLGFEFGSCRLPQAGLSVDEEVALLQDLEEIGFFNWYGMSS